MHGNATSNGHSRNGLNGVPPPPFDGHLIDPGPPEVPELAGILSPSQMSCFMGCSAKWFFRYAMQLDSPQGSALSIGKAMHSAVRVNFEQKVHTREDLEVEGVLAVYEGEWVKEAEVTRFQPDENQEQLRTMGRALVKEYIEKVAPLIEPAAVELPVTGVIAGVPVRGYVDVLDVHGRIIDLKSSKASPPKDKIRPDYRFQLATYARITPGASGAARLDTLVKLKTSIKRVSTEFQITPADQKSIEVLYPLAQEGMRSGLVYPNRNSFLCSRRYCAYASECVKEYGGEVL
jgi:hypothetical protein